MSCSQLTFAVSEAEPRAMATSLQPSRGTTAHNLGIEIRSGYSTHNLGGPNMGNGCTTPTFLMVLNTHRGNVNQLLLPNPHRLGSRNVRNNYISPTFSGVCNAQCGNHVLNCLIGPCRLQTPNKGSAYKTSAIQGVPNFQLGDVNQLWPPGPGRLGRQAPAMAT